MYNTCNNIVVLVIATFSLLYDHVAMYSCVYVDPNTPTIQQLISQVRTEIAPKWYDLGVELLGKKYVKKLKVIGTDNKGNTEGCCTEMFNFWLQTDTKASWTKLVEALRSKSVQHDVLADEIEKKFVAGKLMTLFSCLYISFIYYSL